MNVFKNSAGQVIELAKELGRGGEGVVFDINCRPNQVAKIWHRPNRADSNAVRAYRDAGCKLEIMVANRPEIRTNGGGLFTQKHPFISWPDEILYNRNDEVVGFLMPKVDRSRFYESFHYFIPTARQDMETELNKTFRDKDFLLMARNLAEAVAEVHKSGYIIGDVNEKNVLINDQARVILVDSDSMQMRDSQTGELYRCTKGREDYTPPRLQGCNFGDVDRIQDDDRFGLAVLIFKMTMHGVHPYASRSDPANKNAIAELGEKIKLEYFPYNESGHTPEDYQPSDNYRRAWRDVNFEMRQLFRRAFDPDATNSSERPSPEEWIAELDRIIGLQARPGTRTAPQAPSAAATAATHTIPQRQTDTPPRGRAIFSVTATVLNRNRNRNRWWNNGFTSRADSRLIIGTHIGFRSRWPRSSRAHPDSYTPRCTNSHTRSYTQALTNQYHNPDGHANTAANQYHNPDGHANTAANQYHNPDGHANTAANTYCLPKPVTHAAARHSPQSVGARTESVCCRLFRRQRAAKEVWAFPRRPTQHNAGKCDWAYILEASQDYSYRRLA